MPAPPAAAGLDGLLEQYQTHLVTERGLAESTVHSYMRAARLFVGEQSDRGDGNLEEPGVGEVTAFVVRQVRGRQPASAKAFVQGLRAFLRFLDLAGKIAHPLQQVVPTVACWRLSTLPKALAPGEIDRLLNSCDQRTPVGRRDFAILTLLARPGLRAGEVASLRTSDIDWRRGEIMIRGKGDRVERLPLPPDVGQAIVIW